MNTEKSDLRVRIARLTIERFILKTEVIGVGDIESLCTDDLDKAHLGKLMEESAGVFVSLKKKGDLRGCIGTIAPTTGNITEEIIRNALCASTEDPRFDPVTAEEIPLLEISVDVLGKAVVVESSEELDPSVWGVIVSYKGRRGLLLPDLEGVDTVEAQLAIACRKAGIDPSSPYGIEKFTVTRYR